MLVEHISNFCYAIYVFLMFSMLAECILNSRQVTSYQYRIYVTNMRFNIMYLILTEHTLSYCEAMFFEYIRIGWCWVSSIWTCVTNVLFNMVYPMLAEHNYVHWTLVDLYLPNVDIINNVSNVGRTYNKPLLFHLTQMIQCRQYIWLMLFKMIYPMLAEHAMNLHPMIMPLVEHSIHTSYLMSIQCIQNVYNAWNICRART